MKYPRFLAEMGTESRRRDLLMGIWSGYTLSVTFGVLAIVAASMRLVPSVRFFLLLVLAKLATNTLALVCWKLRRYELDTGGLNVAMDLVVMTGAIYGTGGQGSPLVSLYVIEIGVLAMLTNVGITVLCA